MERKELTQEEIDRISAELELISEEERKEIERVCGPDFTWWDIPAYIRQRNEEIRREQAEIMQEEEYRERERERREKEDFETFLADIQI